jgi:protein-tyrosine phosphatase
LPALVKSGTVLTLADRGRHVLLELPHDRYVPLEPLLVALGRQGLTGILSHPERNRGLIAEPAIVETLVQQGCLMQITAGSLLGQFGASAERLARFLVERRLCHFVASDAHDTRRRPFGLGAAHQAVARLADESFADTVCRENPALVTAGREVACRSVGRPKRRVGLSGWLKTG